MASVVNTVQEGANSLLMEAANVMRSFDDVKYMIIGGWCPYLRNKTTFPHPGTLDVDLFFQESHKENALSRVIKRFLEQGFSPSAKHDFQLLKPIRVKDFDFIFNIDLLHPLMVKDIGNNMFVDQLDLDVPYDAEEYRIKKIVSIVVPNSKVLFESNLFDEYIFRGIPINLMSFEGLFLTKMDSFTNIKRPRDSFDIYLGFKGEQINVSKIEELAQHDERIKKSLDGFQSYLGTKGKQFNDNIFKFIDDHSGNPAEEILSQFR